MGNKKIYFYDESGHDRVLTEKLFEEDKIYFDFFSTAFVGIAEDELEEIYKKYSLFEEKYSNKELKSQIISVNECDRGLLKVNEYALKIYDEYLDFLLENNIEIFFYSFNKIEQIIRQLFINNPILHTPSYIFSITKLLFLYKDRNLIKLLLNKNTVDEFIDEFRRKLDEIFFLHLNEESFSQENESILIIYKHILNYNSEINYNFSYESSFCHLYFHLKRNKIENYFLFIDKEGKGRTLNYARIYFERNKTEQKNSKEEIGIRIADMFVGLLSRLLFALNKYVVYPDVKQAIDANESLDTWIDMDKKTFNLYVKIAKVLLKNSNTIDLFTQNYNEPYLTLIIFILYLSKFDSFEEYRNFDKKKIKEYLTDNVVGCLTENAKLFS